VVTFNQTQQVLIETLLDARRRENQNLDRAIAASSDEPLFIKNLENVQGDERDVIFFSITYGPDAAGKITMNFGPLNGEGGHRRLNVAITRAREGVVIYSTLLPQQIDLARVRATGVRDLKNYLEFALKGPRALVEQSLPTGLEPDSPFETAVIKELRNHGWVVHPQVGCSGYRIDLGVVDPRAPGRYLVGIECDGRSYHSGATARDRDRLRQHVLEGLGWRIHRIWSTDWWLNPEAEVDKVLRRLQEILDSEESTDSEPLVKEGTALEPVVALDAELVQEDDGEPVGEDIVPPAATTDETDAQDHAVYRLVSLTPGDPIEFYEHRSSRALSAQLQQVIDEEGPLPELALFRRVARAWGLERTGSKIVERLKGLVPASAGRTVEGDVTFYWPASVQTGSWTGFRLAGPEATSKRHVSDVAIEEVANLVVHVLEVGGAAPRSDVAKSVCRLIGMARTTADAEARVVKAMDLLCSQGRATDLGASIRL
jgi:very-short-patch-repair endonuclease